MIDILTDACFLRTILGSAGAFLLGMLSFWSIFALNWKRQLELAKKENIGLKETLDQMKKEKGSGSMILSGSLFQKKNGRSAQNAYGQFFAPSNFAIIDGVNHKIAALLELNGIKDWKDLANADLKVLAEYMLAAGIGVSLQEIENWQLQATWAITENWQKLESFQLDLALKRGDKRTKIQELMITMLGFNPNPENLQIIEGIDDIIESALKKAGIKSWKDLAEREETELSNALTAQGMSGLDTATWPKQARLAVEDKWLELSRYQDQLHDNRNID